MMSLDVVLLTILFPTFLFELLRTGQLDPLLLLLSVPLAVFYLLLHRVSTAPNARAWVGTAKKLILVFMLTLSLGTLLGSNIYKRITNVEGTYVHDNPIQVEEAARMLFAGKNPYREDYTNTPLMDWSGGNIGHDENGNIVPNPAMYHLVKLPFHIVLSAPFFWLGEHMLGWYDERLLYAAAFALSLLLLWKIAPTEELKLASLVLMGWNPLLVHFFLMGRDDIFVFFWILLAVYLAVRKRTLFSSLALAAAVGSKHFAWFVVPFYFLYLFFKTPKTECPAQRLRMVWSKTWPFFLASAVIFLPFLVWDAPAFIDDIFGYTSGFSPTSYPIRGYGLGAVLVAFGVISSSDQFPFWILQLVVSIALLVFLGLLQRRRNTLAAVLFNAGVLLFAFLFVSRFFNDNYFGFLSLLFITAWLLSARLSARQ